ncbi:MAG: CoA transferase subunit A [Candidatus Contendobacter sp.]|jgi:glutaconate CoA-transferase subunit A|nr:CoA transferase subunit A [Candidatus Contendobacter sp.]
MTHKLITLPQAVARFTRDGMQYASGAALPVGADAVVFGRELIRQNRRQLHAIFHSNTQQLNLLCAAGAVDKLECGFTGLEGFGFANGLRRAVESGRVVLEDYSNLSMVLRFLGGALNWPFVPATVNIGTDLQFRSAFHPDEYASPRKIPPVIDPFSGQEYGALSPLRPELAVIHVTLADPEGNAIMLGSEWSRFELSRAARRVVLVTDALVATDCMRQFPNLVRIPGLLVEAVVYWPFSAWPQASPGIHDLDELHMRLMNEALGTPEGYAGYRRDFIDSYQTLDEYLALIGPDRITALSATATGFLLDPYRRWLLSRADIDELLAESEAS